MKNKSQLNSKHEPKEILHSLRTPYSKSPIQISTDVLDDHQTQTTDFLEPTIRAYNAVMRFKSYSDSTIIAMS